MNEMRKFFPLVKVDEATRTAYGMVTAEVPDKDGEICDYQSAKAAYTAWSNDSLAKTTAAGQEPSLGNIRVQHQLELGGKVTGIDFKDAQKQVWLATTPANDAVWSLLKGGFLTGFSHGGSYTWRKPDGQYWRYGIELAEVSYVDKPCLGSASFAYVKADGSTEFRKFHRADGAAGEKGVAKAMTEVAAEVVGAEADGGEKADAAPMRKCLCSVSDLAWTLDQLNSIRQQADWEAEFEQDGSPLGSRLKDAVRMVGQILQEMVAEEVGELTGDAPDHSEEVGKMTSQISELLKRGKSLRDHVEKLREAHKALGGHLDKLAMAIGDDGGKGEGDDGADHEKAIIALIEKAVDERVTKALEAAPQATAVKGMLVARDGDNQVVAGVDPEIEHLCQTEHFEF